MSLRAILAILICKLLRVAARLFRRGGTAMPGYWALKVCPELLAVLSRDVKSVAVTGTNGKSTTVRMVEQALEDAGMSYFANRSGANLISGIVTEFVMNCSVSGKMKKEYAVIECDEWAAKTVFPQMRPTAVIVTNIFRDQLDRFGEVANTVSGIRAGLEGSPDTVMCLNADCALTASLSSLPNRTVWYGMNNGALSAPDTADLTDFDKCPVCGGALSYGWVNYGHLGGYACAECGFKRPMPDFAVTYVAERRVNGTSAVIASGGKNRLINIPIAGLYNVYNAAGAMAAMSVLGISANDSARAIEHAHCGFGRMEQFDIGESGATMILVKNAAGCNQVIDFLRNVKGRFSVVLVMNNNVSDGTDISWLNDTDFEALAGFAGLERVAVSGMRMEETERRLLDAGVDRARIERQSDYTGLVEWMMSREEHVFILPTYTGMMELRGYIVKAVGGKDFWE